MAVYCDEDYEALLLNLPDAIEYECSIASNLQPYQANLS